MQCRAVSLSIAEAWKGFVVSSQIFRTNSSLYYGQQAPVQMCIQKV